MYTEKKLNYNKTKNKALKFLEYRMHSERELYDKLKRAGAEPVDIEKVIDFLREYKLLDDWEFAKRYTDELKNSKKFGEKRVKAELMKKGISSGIIEDTVKMFEWDEEDVLYPMLKKKLSGNFEKKSIDRCVRYFIYRGYSYDEIKKAIERAQTEEEDGV